MADYTIIADISTYIINILREGMCPEPIAFPSQIEGVTLTDRTTDYLLGLYLYDMQEEQEIALPLYLQAGRVRLQKPPKPYSLYYMIFVNASIQTGLRAPDVQKIIGRAAQIIADYSSVPPELLQPCLDSKEPLIVLSQNKITLAEKMRIWQAADVPYQISLFYKAAPVFISSEIIVDTPRVVQADFHISMAEEERRNQ